MSPFLVINFDEFIARSVNPYGIIDAIQELNGKHPAPVVGNGRTGYIIKCSSSLQTDQIHSFETNLKLCINLKSSPIKNKINSLLIFEQTFFLSL